ncbi:MAG: porin [Burkholderiales bacterium]|nr:porin [Burkholderiales bacterium]
MGVTAALGSIAITSSAESQVTLYGHIEEGVMVQKQRTLPAQVELVSGMDQGSRWGIRGTEDLGNGSWVGVILEQGFSANDGTINDGSYGTGNSGFTREAILNAGGDWGSFAMGRTGALSFTGSRSILTGWLFGMDWEMGGWSAYVNSPGRMNNTITYQTPDFGGFKVSLMYSNGVGKDTSQWSHNTHYYGIGIIYDANHIRSSLIYENLDWKGSKYGNDDHNPVHGDQNQLNFGFEYDFGSWTPGFAYQWSHQKNGQQINMFGINAKIDAGGGDLLIGFKYIFGKDTSPYKYANGLTGLVAEYGDNKQRLWQIDIAYIYPLSKRTSLKFLGSYSGGGKSWNNDEWLASKFNGFSPSVGQIYNGYQLMAGLSHSF